MALDVNRIREDFPALSRKVNGHPLAYLDSAATSQKPRQVIEAMTDYYERYNSNVHRGIHTLAEEATAAYEAARNKVAAFVGADSRSTVFVRNTTEAINLVAYAWARRNLGPSDEIVCGVIEHHSNIVPWQMIAGEVGATVRYVDVTDEGELDDPTGLINDRTKLVTVTGMSNVLGTIIDTRAIADAAHAVGALVLVDGAQLVPHQPCDFTSTGADILVFSAHKMCGPTGIGALVARPEVLDSWGPFMGGGEMIRDVALEGTTYADIPHRFEAGTPAIAEAVGFGAAVDYLTELGMENVAAHETETVAYALKVLADVEGVEVYGPTDPARRGAAVAFNLFDSTGDLIHPHDSGTMLDTYGLAVRAGHHCARPLMRRLGVPATCRASAYIYNTTDEFDRLAEALVATRRFFEKG